jgi:hypothetical protein
MSQAISLAEFLTLLEKSRIYYEVAHQREDEITVLVRIPGQYWEVDFRENGTVAVERFLSTGRSEDSLILSELLAQFPPDDDSLLTECDHEHT